MGTFLIRSVYNGLYAIRNECKRVHKRILPREAMLARYMPQSCVCLSVCLSVTSQCSTETAKRRIRQTTAHDSPGTA